MSHDRLNIQPGDEVEIDLGTGPNGLVKPKLVFTVQSAHNCLSHKDADDSWFIECVGGYYWQQETDGGTVRLLHKGPYAVDPVLVKKPHRQGINSDPKAAHRNDPIPPIYRLLDTGLEKRYTDMIVRLSGHELDEEFTRDWFETMYSLMHAALGDTGERAGNWAPIFATVLDKYDQLLVMPIQGAHDGFGNS